MFDLGHYRGEKSREISGNSQPVGADPDSIFEFKAERCVTAAAFTPRGCRVTPCGCVALSAPLHETGLRAATETFTRAD
jgi:hypothetical protein